MASSLPPEWLLSPGRNDQRIANELAFMTLMEVSDLVRTRRLPPVELAMAMLARIEAVDPELHGYTLVTPEIALDEVRAAEAEIMPTVGGVPCTACRWVSRTCASPIASPPLAA